jgi:homoserine O-acetyltransferase/O-succinyltransferase
VVQTLASLLTDTKQYTFAHPPHQLELECGRTLGPVALAYETYGELNAAKDNAILVLHALSGDAHAAGVNTRLDDKPGWWDIMIGPGRPFDTDRYFVVCSNIIGGCKGSTGPSSTNLETMKPYGLSFPMITIRDMVEAQRHLIDFLGIERLYCVTGGSMGGMQALQWVASYPDRVAKAIPIATAASLSAQGIAFNEVGRQAIMSDPDWLDGDYYGITVPHRGLALARMVGHITYLSEQSMHAKFARRLQEKADYGYDFATDFQVESYLKYKGDSFVNRFDANSYLYITKAMDYFDLARAYGSLEQAFAHADASFLVISFSSDWLFPTYQSKEIVRALRHNNLNAIFTEIPSAYGHDAFLLEADEIGRLVRSFLNGGPAKG